MTKGAATGSSINLYCLGEDVFGAGNDSISKDFAEDVTLATLRRRKYSSQS